MPKRTVVRRASPTKPPSANKTTRSRATAKAVAPVAVARKKAGKAPTPRRASATPGPAAARRAARTPAQRPMHAAVRSLAPRAAAESAAVPVSVVTVTDVYSGDPRSSPGSAEFAYRLLAEGDSWFTIGGIPSSNLLYELRLPQSGIVCNIASPGDTLVRIADLARNRDLQKLLTERFGYRWHAILLSAGGNDLMDRAGQLLRNPDAGSSDPRDYLVTVQVEDFVRDVQDGYRIITGLRDAPQSANAGVPIVVHGYDYPTPRDAPARFITLPVLGPWLQRAYDDHGIAEDMRIPITNFLVDVLAEAIKVLAEGPSALPDFHFVETRGALQRAAAGATGVSGDWLNEIHPSPDGYRKIAARIGEKVRSLLAR